MVDIHLYGKLRSYGNNIQTGEGTIVKMDPKTGETIASLLARIGITEDEIYNIFFNARLLATRSTMAHWLGYQQVRADPLDWDLNVPVKSGDRIGLFGKDMAALVV